MFIWFSPFQGHKSKVKWFLVTEIKRKTERGDRYTAKVKTEDRNYINRSWQVLALIFQGEVTKDLTELKCVEDKKGKKQRLKKDTEKMNK